MKLQVSVTWRPRVLFSFSLSYAASVRQRPTRAFIASDIQASDSLWCGAHLRLPDGLAYAGVGRALGNQGI
jgi:hypothetical protein